jgi:hypothetical protein
MAYSIHRSYISYVRARRYTVLLIFAAVVLICGAGYITYKKLNPPGPISSDISKKASFSILYLPNEDPQKDTWVIDRSSILYDSSASTLFITYKSGDNKIVVSQQATPDAFKDIPNYYQKFLDKFHQYRDISTSIGTITLTHPEELKGKQSAVAHIKDTLLFANPDKDLSEEEWKGFFNAFEIIR